MRSFIPQATVTGTSAGTAAVNGENAAKMACMASAATTTAAMSPRACAGLILLGFATSSPNSRARPAVLRVSAGTAGRKARPQNTAV